MTFTLTQISGVGDAILSLLFSRRSYTPEKESQILDDLFWVSTPRGFIHLSKPSDSSERIEMYLEKVAKYGAGVNMSASIDAGHDTILRFIDFTVIVQGLHRGAQDDLDAHAMRMCNRIVRSSTRLNVPEEARRKSQEMSDWYKDRIITFEDHLAETLHSQRFEDIIPAKIKRNGKTYVRVENGYLLEGCEDDDDVLRGLYRLSMASDCIFKIDLYDMRHLYKRRNKYTKASPELRMGIESLADQIEKRLPIVGKLVRYDYCADHELHHIAQIDKSADLTNVNLED